MKKWRYVIGLVFLAAFVFLVNSGNNWVVADQKEKFTIHVWAWDFYFPLCGLMFGGFLEGLRRWPLKRRRPISLLPLLSAVLLLVLGCFSRVILPYEWIDSFLALRILWQFVFGTLSGGLLISAFLQKK